MSCCVEEGLTQLFVFRSVSLFLQGSFKKTILNASLAGLVKISMWSCFG